MQRDCHEYHVPTDDLCRCANGSQSAQCCQRKLVVPLSTPPVLVTGAPASGRTTLAARLGLALKPPVKRAWDADREPPQLDVPLAAGHYGDWLRTVVRAHRRVCARNAGNENDRPRVRAVAVCAHWKGKSTAATTAGCRAASGTWRPSGGQSQCRAPSAARQSARPSAAGLPSQPSP